MVPRITKLAISALVVIFDALVWLISAIIGRGTAGTCVVINYHCVPESRLSSFENQIAFLSGVTKPAPPFSEKNFPSDGRFSIVTFDDAFTDLRYALPITKKYGVRVIVFVPTGYMGKESAWYDFGDENPVGKPVLSSVEIKDLRRVFPIELGSHTHMHHNLITLPPSDVQRDLEYSRRTLEAELGVVPNTLSFPYGLFSKREEELASQCGFEYLFSTCPKMIKRGFAPGVIGRVTVQPTDWPLEFKLKVMGGYRWLAAASRVKHFLRTAIK